MPLSVTCVVSGATAVETGPITVSLAGITAICRAVVKPHIPRRSQQKQQKLMAGRWWCLGPRKT